MLLLLGVPLDNGTLELPGRDLALEEYVQLIVAAVLEFGQAEVQPYQRGGTPRNPDCQVQRRSHPPALASSQNAVLPFHPCFCETNADKDQALTQAVGFTMYGAIRYMTNE